MGTVTQAQLLSRTLEVMEDELRIPKKNARDFTESLASVVEESIAEGDKVSLFGIVTITPVGVPAKPRRKGTDRLTGEEKMLDATPAKVRVKALASTRVKSAAPEPTDKYGKRLISEAKERSRKAAERLAEREAQAEKDAKKAARGSKASGKKSSGKKK